MTILHLPIDHRLRLNQARDLLRQHCKSTSNDPIHVLFPSSQGPAEWTLVQDMKWRSYESGEIISVDLQHKWERVAVTEKVIALKFLSI